MAWYTDRKWMYERTDSDGFLNSEYCDNVDLFLDFAFSNDVVDTWVNMRGETIRELKCPCYKCQNISFRDRATVQQHLYRKGFMLRYETWSEHGGNSIREVGQSSTTMEVDDNDDGYKRMVLDNMYACGYTSNTIKGHEPNAEAKRFYGMLQAADEPLWEGEKATKFDKDLWSRAAGGIKKGKMYGLSNVSGLRAHGRQDPKIEKLHLVIKELVKEKEEDKERLNGIIMELMAEKEKEKAEKDAILNRMTNIETLLKSVVR